jgi:hypothetical protein
MKNEFRISRENSGMNKRRRIVNRPDISPVIQNKEKEKMQRFSEKTESYFKFLEEKNNSINENESPFYATLPPINEMTNLSVISGVKKNELISVYSGTKLDSISDEYDLVTIIPFRTRYLHLDKVLDTLNKSRLETDYKIGIVIVENSSEPLSLNIGKKYKECHYRWIDSKNKIFNKCICHNIGVRLTRSKFVHFHDCDLMVPKDFYSKMLSEIIKKEAIQCFRKRRVNYLHETQSKKIFDGEDPKTFIENGTNYRIGNEGAPGGSIALTRDLFEKIGGFDAHLFWSYSIEDAFFWKKMETKELIGEVDVEMYHLWHPPAYGKNPQERTERKYFDAFCRLHDKSSYLNIAREIYNETTNLLIK